MRLHYQQAHLGRFQGLESTMSIIRAYYQQENPDSVLLMKETSVQYWVGNRTSLIGDVKLPKSFPKLNGRGDGQLLKVG
jgi:hypothetical protein